MNILYTARFQIYRARRIYEKYWFAEMNVFVKKYKISYFSCMYYKQTSGERWGEIYFIEETTLPFYVDYCMFKRKYIFVCHIFMKFMVIKSVKDTNERQHRVLQHTLSTIEHDRKTIFIDRIIYEIFHVFNIEATPQINRECKQLWF